jgi:CheY-like chemotaxis protein
MLRRVIGEDIDLVTRLGREIVHVQADPGQIEQVIMNLAVNARDAMPGGGRLIIETAQVVLDESFCRDHPPTPPGKYVMLALTDSGAGMDAETRSHLFEPFFTTKEKGKGTGLGLATAYGVVKQSGGYIWVESRPRQGTTFHVFLPRVEGLEEAAGPAAAEPAEGFAGETILLVEDQEAVRHLMREILEMSGYVILEAASGREALRISSEHKAPIRLMVTDVVMPGMTGTELGQQLRALRPEMKVLYISGYADDALHEGVLDAGSAFLQKPVKAAELERVVRQLLEKTE